MDTGLYKSIVWVHALVGVLARRGIDRDELFHDVSVQPALLGDSRARISLDEWRALVQRAMQLTQDPGLALTITSTVPDSIYQIVGQMAAVCSSMREAMRMFERYRPLLGNINRFDMVEEGERAYFVFTPLYPDPEALGFDAELALGLAYRLSRRNAARDSDDAQEVWFTHTAPSYAERYAEVFRCPVYFGRLRNAILFDRKHLEEPLIYANPILLEVLREGADRMLAAQGTPDLLERVRTMLRHEVELRGVDATRIARLLKLDVRSLRRQLVEADTNWARLLDEARQRRARDELGRGGIPIRELAAQLGFSDQSAFSRAFKRWTGTTPAKYSRGATTTRLPANPNEVRRARTSGTGRQPALACRNAE